MRLTLLALLIAQIALGFEVPDGFVVQPAADPGTVEFPIFAAFDDKDPASRARQDRAGRQASKAGADHHYVIARYQAKNPENSGGSP